MAHSTSAALSAQQKSEEQDRSVLINIGMMGCLISALGVMIFFAARYIGA